ncbi:MAG: hypothetical protein JRI80_19160 [Deltaproteobacteria bacterium]|nr:hypothetical protein [Deltaproteobacteria bacterium]
MINLDFLCMQTAQAMMECQGEAGMKEKENVAIKGLGVLLENGPYGLMLYLETHDKKDISQSYMKKLIGLCREKLVKNYIRTEEQVPSDGNFQQITKWLQELAQDLDSYLFVKAMWQQTLTYARYHAKALKDAEEANLTEQQEDTR